MQKTIGLLFLLYSVFLYTTPSSAQNDTELDTQIPAPPPISGRVTTILPADVLARSLLLRQELNLIRIEMGKPQNQQLELALTNAAPREVFFQAQTLFHKSDLLAFEYSGGYVDTPSIPNVDMIKPLHVWQMLNSALRRIQVVKHQLGIEGVSKEVEQDTQTTPTQVFRSIVQANRQINLLLEKKMAPSDVYERITLATNYAAKLLSRFPDSTLRPLPFAFERGKMPADVYRRLLSILKGIREIYERSGLQMLTLNVTDADIKGSVPSDVYDIASLLVSELSYIHSKTRHSQAPAKAYYPGKKFPSHVYQRAGILEQQIADLLVRVKENPQWMEL